MRVFVEFALSSDTTEAIVSEPDGSVLGRGSSDRRSDDDVACAVARREALAVTRLTLVRRSLSALRLDPSTVERVMRALEARWRAAWHYVQLKRLGAQLLAEVEALERLYPAARLEPAVREVIAGMRTAPEPFDGARGFATSLRDQASRQWTRLARAAATSPERPYEALLAVFDRAILAVEAQTTDLPLSIFAGVAVSDAVASGDLAASRGSDIERELERAACVPLEVTVSQARERRAVELPVEVAS